LDLAGSRVDLSLLAQTLDNCMQIKVEALQHQKERVKQVVSSGTPRQFIIFYHGLKQMAELLGI